MKSILNQFYNKYNQDTMYIEICNSQTLHDLIYFLLISLKQVKRWLKI
jgi:hypothetical protein